MYLLVRITLLCSCGSFFCEQRIGLSWSRSVLTSVCCLAGHAMLVFVLEEGRGHKWSRGMEHKIRSQNTGTVSFLCVSHIFITPQDQVNSCLGRPTSSELKSRYCPRADVTHECKASSGALSKGRCLSCTMHKMVSKFCPSADQAQISCQGHL